MGSYASKFLARNAEESNETKIKQNSALDQRPCTPIDGRRTLSIDPRSATVGIPRTPIEVNYIPPFAPKQMISAIPEYLTKKPYLETDLDDIDMQTPKKSFAYRPSANGSVPSTSTSPSNAPTHTPSTVQGDSKNPLVFGEQAPGDTQAMQLRYKILGIDPRSPATDFDRTPILSWKSMNKFKTLSQENLNGCGNNFETDISYPTSLSYCETTTDASIPEIQALPDILSNVNRSFISNAVTENSDKFDSPSSSSSSNSSVETISDSSEQITVIRNMNAIHSQEMEVASAQISPNSSAIDIPKADKILPLVPQNSGINDDRSWTLANDVDRVLCIAATALEEQQCSMEVDGAITVWRDSTSPGFNATMNGGDDYTSSKNDANRLPQEEIMIEFDDVQVIKTVNIQPTEKSDKKQEDVKKTKKQALAEKKKKIVKVDSGVFIDEKIFAAEDSNINLAPKIRTPLGNRSNNHAKSNNMPMKSPQQLLRTKVMTTKLHQENTPPRHMKTKLNGTQWDPDSTVMI